MEKDNKALGLIIGVAVALLLGAILIQIIADSVNSGTTLATYTDTVDISPLRMAGGGLNYTLAESNKLYASAILSHPAGTNDERRSNSDCTISTVKYYNQSGALMSNSADYTWVEDGNDIDGWLRLKNVLNLNGSSSNSTTITYSTCPTGYVNGWAATVTKMTIGFFALAILLVVVGVVMYLIKEYD